MVAEDTAASVTAERAPAVAGEALAQLNASLAALGQPFKLALVDPRSLKELDKNAHYMTHEVFKGLVQNLARDRALSSLPFCWFDGTIYHTLSGNHRVKAAIAAGLELILVLYDDRPLTRQERVAVQLSHNALVGKDDPTLLKELWDEIDDLALKHYAGLDDKALKQLADASLKSVSDAALSYKAVSFLFLPEEVEALDAAFQKAMAAVVCEDAYLLPLREFERLIDALDKTKSSWNTKNGATALFLILEVFERHLTDLAEGWLGRNPEAEPETPLSKPKHHQRVPLAGVLGTDKVPAKLAVLLKRAVEHSGKGPLEALEAMAHKYLAGE